MISGLVFIALGVTAMIILLWLVHSDTVRYYKSIQDGYVSDMLRDPSFTTSESETSSHDDLP
jgi:hypothetical protein